MNAYRTVFQRFPILLGTNRHILVDIGRSPGISLCLPVNEDDLFCFLLKLRFPILRAIGIILLATTT